MKRGGFDTILVQRQYAKCQHLSVTQRNEIRENQHNIKVTMPAITTAISERARYLVVKTLVIELKPKLTLRRDYPWLGQARFFRQKRLLMKRASFRPRQITSALYRRRALFVSTLQCTMRAIRLTRAPMPRRPEPVGFMTTGVDDTRRLPEHAVLFPGQPRAYKPI